MEIKKLFKELETFCGKVTAPVRKMHWYKGLNGQYTKYLRLIFWLQIILVVIHHNAVELIFPIAIICYGQHNWNKQHPAENSTKENPVKNGARKVMQKVTEAAKAVSDDE